MSDRDELVSGSRLRTCPAHPGHAPFLAAYGCPWCTITSLQAGRFTVTPEQVEAIARLMAYRAGSRLPDSDKPYWISVAKDVAGHLGLSVTEDGQ